MTVTTSTQTLTVSDLFGIDSCHDYVHELADMVAVPARIDMDEAEQSLRDTLSAYLPYGWDIDADDKIVQHTDDADTLNISDVRTSGVFLAIRFFDLADYVTA